MNQSGHLLCSKHINDKLIEKNMRAIEVNEQRHFYFAIRSVDGVSHN
jgi:hypothetical protein